MDISSICPKLNSLFCPTSSLSILSYFGFHLVLSKPRLKSYLDLPYLFPLPTSYAWITKASYTKWSALTITVTANQTLSMSFIYFMLNLYTLWVCRALISTFQHEQMEVFSLQTWSYLLSCLPLNSGKEWHHDLHQKHLKPEPTKSRCLFQGPLVPLSFLLQCILCIAASKKILL